VAPNGTVETLLEFAARAVHKDGAEYLTMGIVPLLILGEVDAQREPSWLVWARKWAKAHYTRFYNFRGLLEFKAKFRPTRWAPVVVAVRGPGFRLGHLRGIVRAFTGMPPEAAFGIGILRGIRLEIESTWRHLTKR
jgi:phosphatidylglycerol lysyltransferase